MKPQQLSGVALGVWGYELRPDSDTLVDQMISDFQILRRVLFCTTLLVGGLSAQRTWVVDANGGAGVHYRDLPAAVAAAANDDRIVVRAGVYTQFSTAKGLRVLGEPGATIGKQGGLPTAGVSIHDVGVGRLFILSGINFANESMIPAVQLKDCLGPVVLADIPRAAGVFVVNCKRVSMRRTLLTGRPPILAIAADVLLEDVKTKGDAGFLIPNVGSTPSSPAVQLVSARIVAVRSIFEGGGRWTQNIPLLPTAPAFDLNGSNVRIIGSECRAGAVTGTGLPQPVVVGSQSSFDTDPTTVLIPFAGAPAVRGVKTTSSPTAALLVGPAQLGSKLSLELISQPGDSIWILAGVTGNRVAVPGFGDFYLSLQNALVVAQGTQAALPLYQVQIALPNNPAAKGAAVTWQAIRFSTAAGASLSNPADTVLR